MSNKTRGIFNYDYLNKEIKDWLKYYDLELEDLAISIGMTERTLKRTLNNEREFYLNEMYRLIDTLKIKKEDIQKTFFNIINKDELLKDIKPLKATNDKINILYPNVSDDAKE